MKRNTLQCIALLAAMGLHVSATAQQQETGNARQALNQEPVVVFVCEHGSAKSTVAAAHFNNLARERGLKLRAVSRGTNPDEEVAPKAAQGLESDGLTWNGAKPQKFTAADVAGAVRVVTFVKLPEGFNKSASVELWDDIPPVSEDYNRSRDAIVARLKRLLDELVRR